MTFLERFLKLNNDFEIFKNLEIIPEKHELDRELYSNTRKQEKHGRMLYPYLINYLIDYIITNIKNMLIFKSDIVI